MSGGALGLGLWPEGSDWEFRSKASLDVDGVLSEGIEVICLMALEGLGGVEGVGLGLVGVSASESSGFVGGAAFFGLWEFSVGGCGLESWGVVGSRGPEVPWAGPWLAFGFCVQASDWSSSDSGSSAALVPLGMGFCVPASACSSSDP